MLVNVYKDDTGAYFYKEPNSDSDLTWAQNSETFTFLGQKEETLVIPKKKVMKYRWVYNNPSSGMEVSDGYYSSKEEFSKSFKTLVPIQPVDSTGILMDEDKISL